MRIKKLTAALLILILLVSQTAFAAQAAAAESGESGAAVLQTADDGEAADDAASLAAAEDTEAAAKTGEIVQTEQKGSLTSEENAESAAVPAETESSIEETASEHAEGLSSEEATAEAQLPEGTAASEDHLAEGTAAEGSLSEGASLSEGLAAKGITAAEGILAEETTEAEAQTPEEEEKLTPYNMPEGVYIIHTVLDDSKVLESPGGTRNPGVAMQFFANSSEEWQKFRIKKNADGTYRIYNAHSDKILEIKKESEAVGAGVVQNFATSKLYQKWTFKQDAEGNILIFSAVKKGYCLCVEKGKATNKAKIRTAVPKAGDASQRFHFECVKEAADDQPAALTAGVYAIRTALDTNMAVDIEGGKTTKAANVQIYRYNGSKAQQFIVSPIGTGLYTITNVGSGRTLDTYEGLKKKGTSCVQYLLDGGGTQHWIPEPADRGYYYLKNAGSGMYLDVQSAKRTNGTNVQIYTGNKSEAQKFRFELLDEKRTVPDGLYIIRTRLKDSMVLDVKGASINNTANVQIFTDNGTNAQKFRVSYAGDGYYTILNENSGKALDVKGTRNKAGTNVQQYTANGTKAQKWKFVPEGDGYFSIESGVGFDKVLDVYGGKSSNGRNIQIYTANGTNAQQFRLSITKKKEEPKYTVEIDPGHQRYGNSSREPIGPGASVTKAKCTSGATSQWTGQDEYVLNLEVALKLKAELEKRGYKVCMTRTTHDVNMSNKERAQKATKDKADILVRIHADDIDATSVNGVLNIAPASGNPYLPAQVVKDSQRLARLLTKYQCRATGQRQRSNIYTNNMSGINWATMPVSIVEMGCMSNRTEAYNLTSSQFQSKIAKGIADGIDAYFANENP